MQKSAASTGELFSKKEKLVYDLYINGIVAGTSELNYIPNIKSNTYKLTIDIKTRGIIRAFYRVNDKIVNEGTINNTKLITKSQTTNIQENRHTSSKHAVFDHTNEIISIKDNLNNNVENYILLDSAKDPFSYLFSFRFSTDITKLKEPLVKKDITQFVEKTFENKVTISDPYVTNINRYRGIEVRDISFESRRIRFLPITEEAVKQIKNGTKKSSDYIQELIINKPSELEEKTKITVTNDANQTPLIVEYKTRFGSFRAVLTDSFDNP